MPPRLSATDGLPMRENGEYAKEKLRFLDYYLPSALTATTAKRHRVYVDLFAGPGINASAASEYEGGALRALKASSRNGAVTFTDAVLVNKDRDRKSVV